MTELLRTAPHAPVFVTRRRLTRTAAAVASGGLIVGMGAVAAGPAVAATADDCDGANTLTAPTDDAADIQTLLDANTAIVCLEGTFALPPGTPLTFDHDLTLFGLSSAELDGNALSQILVGSSSAQLTVQNISFVNGRAFNGGAIYLDGDLVVENSAFEANASIEHGGAIYLAAGVDSPSVQISGSTFTANSTGDDFDGYSGGAIFAIDSSTFIIEDSIFTQNTASFLGGAVYGFAVLVDNSTFIDNEAAFGGGAVYGGLAAAFESTFAENEALGGGALLTVGYGAAFGSTFVDNHAGEVGGAIASYGDQLILNSTFVSNTAADVGGAVFADVAEIALSTFLSNTADNVSEGAQSDSVFVQGEEQTRLGGNIFAGTRTTAHLGSDDVNVYDDRGGNVFSTSESTESALGTPHASTLFSQSVTEIFGSTPGLADNGGATETVALVAGSPAIDIVPELVFDVISLDAAAAEFEAAAELYAAVDDFSVDQRGVARTGILDAGAFEFGDAELAATGPDESTTTLLSGFAALLVGIGAAFAIGTRRISRSGR